MSFLADIRFVRCYLVLGVAGVVSYHWVNGKPAYWLIGIYGVAGMAVGAWRTPRVQRTPWVFLAAGVASWVAADIAWRVAPHASSPNLSDGLYVVAYPMFAIGLVLLMRQVASDGLGAAIDAAIVGLTIATSLWPPLFATVRHDHESLASLLTVGAYPCWDLLFVLLAVRIAFTRALHTRRTLLLLGSVALFFVGDLLWLDSVDTHAFGGWMDYFWLLAYIGFGAAALHPTGIGRATVEAPSAWRRFLLLALPVALLPTVQLGESFFGHPFTLADASLISCVLLLVLGRLGMVLQGLEVARAELREQNRLKDELISVVSHDLRTPLTSIMGYLELALAEDTDQATGREFLEVVKRNTARLHRLVEDLLFVSRVQSGRESLDLAPVSLGRLADETVAAALPAAEAAEVSLAYVVDSDDLVLGDAHRLTEVLENLLSNAVKFTPPGGRVDVWVGRRDAMLAVRVSDTGVGIAPDDVRHLYDRFFRAPAAEGVPGAGLGLSIVKAIVEAHGGRVTVESELGAGTTFEVRLPLAVAQPAPREPVAL